MKYGLYILMLSFLCFCCMSFKKHVEGKNLDTLKGMLNAKRNFDHAHIRFDGVYNLYDTTVSNSGRTAYQMYFLCRTMVFYSNGMLLNSTPSFKDSSSATEWLRNFMLVHNKQEDGQEGVFNINNDTVDIVCYKLYWIGGPRYKYFLTHFKGIIKNNDTIANLRVVSPYPDIKSRFKLVRDDYFKKINEIHMLVFKPFPAKTFVDSNNFWINKYK